MAEAKGERVACVNQSDIAMYRTLPSPSGKVTRDREIPSSTFCLNLGGKVPWTFVRKSRPIQSNNPEGCVIPL